MKQKVKYAILRFPYSRTVGKNSDRFEFSQSTFFEKIGAKGSILIKEAGHWREWLGTIEWEAFARLDNQIVTWLETKNPGVIDGESKILENRLAYLWQAFQISFPNVYNGDKPIQVSGDAEIVSGKVCPIDVRAVSSFFPAFPSGWIRDQMIDNELFKIIGEQGSYELWKNLYFALIGDKAEFDFVHPPFLIQLAALTFQRGLQSYLADFRVPDFVRAIETLVGLSIGQTQKTFSPRTMQLLPAWFYKIVQKGVPRLNEYLENLYQVRSDCVHGKSFAWTARKTLNMSATEVIAFEGVSELVSRAVLQTILLNQNVWQYYADRDVLEKSWNDGIFKPVIIG